MNLLGLILLIFISSNSFGAYDPNDEKLAFDRAREAIESLSTFKDLKKNLENELRYSIIGPALEKIAILAPISTGKLELSYNDIRVKYSYYSEKASLEWSRKF